MKIALIPSDPWTKLVFYEKLCFLTLLVLVPRFSATCDVTVNPFYETLPFQQIPSWESTIRLPGIIDESCPENTLEIGQYVGCQRQTKKHAVCDGLGTVQSTFDTPNQGSPKSSNLCGGASSMGFIGTASNSICEQMHFDFQMNSKYWVNEIHFENWDAIDTWGQHGDYYPRYFKLWYKFDNNQIEWTPYLDSAQLSTGLIKSDASLKTHVLEQPFVATKLAIVWVKPDSNSGKYAIETNSWMNDPNLYCRIYAKFDFSVQPFLKLDYLGKMAIEEKSAVFSSQYAAINSGANNPKFSSLYHSQSTYISQTQICNSAWVQVKFISISLVNAVLFSNRGDGGPQVNKYFSISYFTQNDELKTYSNNKGKDVFSTGLHTTENQDPAYRTTFVFDEPIVAKAVRITLLPGSDGKLRYDASNSESVQNSCFVSIRFDILIQDYTTVFQDSTAIEGCTEITHYYSTENQFSNSYQIITTSPIDKKLKVTTSILSSNYLIARSTSSSGVSVFSQQLFASVRQITYTTQATKSGIEIVAKSMYMTPYWSEGQREIVSHLQIVSLFSGYAPAEFKTEGDLHLRYIFTYYADSGRNQVLTKIHEGVYDYGDGYGPFMVYPPRLPLNLLKDTQGRVQVYFKSEQSKIGEAQGVILLTICEVDLKGATKIFHIGTESKQESVQYSLSKELLDEINSGKSCPNFDIYNGQMVVDSIYENGSLVSPGQVIMSTDKTMMTVNIGTAIVQSLTVNYKFAISTETIPSYTDLSLYSFVLEVVNCNFFPELTVENLLIDGRVHTLLDMSLAYSHIPQVQCIPDPSYITLAEDEIGTTLDNLAFYISPQGKLKVNTALWIGKHEPVSFYLYDTVTKRVTRKVSIVPNTCNLQNLRAFLMVNVPMYAVNFPVVPTKKDEFVSWTYLTFYQAMSLGEFDTDDCKKVINLTQLLRLEKDSESYTNPGLQIVDQSLVLNKLLPNKHKVNVMIQNEILSMEVSSPFLAIICGFETIVPKIGISMMQLQLTQEDNSKEYFKDYKLTQLIESSESQCPVIETSYQLVKKDNSPLDRFTGKDFVLVDLQKQQLYVNRQNAIAASFSLFLVGNTVSGVNGGFYEYKFKITNKLNEAPQFEEQIKSQNLTVNQQDQVEAGLGIFMMDSPKIVDPDGHAISIKATGYEKINGLVFTLSKDSFSIKIDLQKLTIDDAGNHEIKITLSDDGPSPKFDNVVAFSLEIKYVPMDDEALKMLLELQEFQKSQEVMAIDGEAGSSEASVELSAAQSQAIVLERKQRLQKQKAQNDKIGYTFPGVSEEQMAAFNDNDAKEKVEDPMIFISTVSSLGEVKISFNQPMFFPSDISQMNYSNIFEFRLVSQATGRIVYAKQTQNKRILQPDDPCLGKWLSQMNSFEKMEYYSLLEYNQEDYLAKCEVAQNRNGKSQDPSQSQGSDLNQKAQNSFTWLVLNHTSTELNLKLEFSDPGEISSSNLGRDELVIELLDIALFKSQITLQSMSLTQFKGKPEIGKSIPPMIDNISVLVSIQDTTNMVSKITTYLSSANFAVGLILGGSMQELYGLIRAMQLMMLQCLVEIPFPAYTLIFFQGVILFAGMDVLSGEAFYEKHFIFKQTSPINQRFDEFGIGDKNFVMNSGSYLIMQQMIVIWLLIKIILRRLCVKFSKYFLIRKIGMMIGKINVGQIKDATLRLLLESYFDISICTFINLIAFYECKSFEELSTFFSTPVDAICSLITIVMFVVIIGFPTWVYKQVHAYRHDLSNPEFLREFGWLFEGLRATEYPVALYQFYFMIRRLYLALILTVFAKQTVIQSMSFIFLSVMNLIYLHWRQPFLKWEILVTEIFNEWCILLSSTLVINLLDPKNPTETRNRIGWTMIVTVASNILINLLIVSYTVQQDIFTALKEYYLQFDEWMNRYKIVNNQNVSDENLLEAKKQFDDYFYCRDWAEQRSWLQENKVEFAHFHEELKFWEIINANDYLSRARNIQFILATQQVAENLKQQKIAKYLKRKFQSRSKKVVLKSKVIARNHQNNSEIQLKTILEVEEVTLSQEISQDEYLDLMDNEGIFDGVNQEADLFQKMNYDRLVKNEVDKIQMQQLDFVFDEPEQEKQKFVELITQRIICDRQQRYSDEFSQNKGIKSLTQGGHQQVVSAVMQCFLPIQEFVKFFLDKEHSKPASKSLQKLYISVFQSQIDHMEYSEIKIDYLTKLFSQRLNAPDFFVKFLNLLRTEIDPKGGKIKSKIDFVNSTHSIVKQTFYGLYCTQVSCFTHTPDIKKYETRKIISIDNCSSLEQGFSTMFSAIPMECPNCPDPSYHNFSLVCGPAILVVSSSLFSLEILSGSYHLLAAVCKMPDGQHYSVVRRQKAWYMFCPEPQEILEQEVEAKCQNITLLFYSHSSLQGGGDLNSPREDEDQDSSDYDNY